jgi:hypothetical protein
LSERGGEPRRERATGPRVGGAALNERRAGGAATLSYTLSYNGHITNIH